MIEDNSVDVIVNWDDSIELVEKLKKDGCTYSLMKQLAQFTVSIHQSDFKQLVTYGAIEEVLEGIYVLPDKEQYDKNTGISLDNHWMKETLQV